MIFSEEFHNSRNAPTLERPPWDGLPVLMMADQKGEHMKLHELIMKCKNLLDVNDAAEERYAAEPENIEAEKAFDETYKAFFEAYMEAVNYIVAITAGKINFNRAKYLVTIKLDEMKRKGI